MTEFGTAEITYTCGIGNHRIISVKSMKMFAFFNDL